MKANNAEYSECMRFERLAHTDLYERLNKKKMKALVPQMVQLSLFGVLLLIFIGSSVAGIDFSRVVSFITSLVLLIEPLQVKYLTLIPYYAFITLCNYLHYHHISPYFSPLHFIHVYYLTSNSQQAFSLVVSKVYLRCPSQGVRV